MPPARKQVKLLRLEGLRREIDQSIHEIRACYASRLEKQVPSRLNNTVYHFLKAFQFHPLWLFWHSGSMRGFQKPCSEFLEIHRRRTSVQKLHRGAGIPNRHTIAL